MKARKHNIAMPEYEIEIRLSIREAEELMAMMRVTKGLLGNLLYDRLNELLMDQ